MEPSHDLAVPQVRAMGASPRYLRLYRRITLSKGSLSRPPAATFAASLSACFLAFAGQAEEFSTIKPQAPVVITEVFHILCAERDYLPYHHTQLAQGTNPGLQLVEVDGKGFTEGRGNEPADVRLRLIAACAPVQWDSGSVEKTSISRSEGPSR